MGVRTFLFALFMLAMSSVSFGQVRFAVAVTIAPPVLPVYEQPICPGDDYIWTPGYWSWGDDISDYYWVPGTWVVAPEAGFLWTPPYWGWDGGSYVFYDGYWGPEIGFYGGIDYGFGYFGVGFVGGRWDHDHFFYNRSVTNVDVTIIHNVYNERVDHETGGNRFSFNGPGGIDRRPTQQEEAAAHQRHIAPISAQVQHVQAARSNPEFRHSANHGTPPVMATPKPGAFDDRGTVRGGANRGAENNAGRTENNGSRSIVHPNDIPPAERGGPAPNTGNAKLDKKYQQEQDKLVKQQGQERQKLQQQQDKEHQQMDKQKADETQKQQLEQRHQQQTQQLVQKHTQQRETMQSRQSAAPRSNSNHPK